MHAWKQRILAAALAAVAMVVPVACGDDDDPGTGDAPSAADRAGAESDGAGAKADGEGAVTADGAIDGPLISILSFDQGFVTLDSDSGAVRAVELDGMGFTDRDQPAVIDGETAWVLGYTPVADQSFTNAVHLARVDLTAGTGGTFVDLGRDRADDDDPDATAWSIAGVIDGTVWVTERIFGDTSFQLVGHDTATGAETARLGFEGDDAPRNLLVVGDTLLAQADGDIVRIDPATGAVEVVVSFFDSLSLGDIIDADELGAYAVTEDGAPLEPGDIESILRVGEPTPNAGWVTDGTSVFWVFDGVRTLERGTGALYGGVVRFDPAAAAFTGVWPLGERYGAYLDEATLTSMSQAQLLVRDGVVWLADVRDDGELVRLDPATGEVTASRPARGDDIDYTRIEMVPTDPDAVWVRVTRFVITGTDADGTSATGTSTLERIDPGTGTAVVTVAEAEIG